MFDPLLEPSNQEEESDDDYDFIPVRNCMSTYGCTFESISCHQFLDANCQLVKHNITRRNFLLYILIITVIICRM